MHQTMLTLLLAISLLALPGTARGLGAAKAIAGEAALTVTRDGEFTHISAGEKRLLEYRASGQIFKPYIKRLYSPKGVQILRDAPHDHIHHHGLMYAIAVDGVDFWAEQPQHHPGKQVPRPVEIDPAATSDAAIQTVIDWSDVAGRRLLTELRTIDARRTSENRATLVTWKSTLRPAEGRDKATLSGRPYFGLGMRFVESMDTDGTMFHSDHAEEVALHDTLKHVRAHWCAYTALADGKRVTVALFDHPANKRHPAIWFTMTAPFAYISATLARNDEPVELSAGSSLTVTYGVAVWDGQIDHKTIENLYRQWQAAP